jgi:hypothetical protein
MTLFTSMGFISTIALTLPIVLLFACRLSWYKSFPALLIYYIIALSYNLISLGYIDVSKEVIFYVGTVANILDAPLILLYLSYFSKTASFRKKLILFIYAFIGYEMIIMAVYGITIKATTIILAPGFFVILALSVLFFVHQVKIAVVHQKAIGKAVMISALLCAYAGYAFVYTVYYLIETPYKEDAKLIFFMITIVTSIPMAAGIFFERKRVLQLAEINTTRQELKAVYSEEENTSPPSQPLDAIVFNVDNKRWN